MKKHSKKMYVAPSIEVVTLENEGVIAASGTGSLPNVGDGGSAFSSAATGGYAATNSDIEEMINDILTY